MMEAVTNSAPLPLQAQEKSPSGAASQPRKKSKPSAAEADFQGALAQAAGAPNAIAVDPKGVSVAQQAPPQPGVDPQTQRSRVSNVRTSSAEKSPQTQKAAASTNAAAAIAGPKPWSTEWVFTGGEANDPELKPLLGARPESSPLLRAAGGETGAAAGPERARAVAAAKLDPGEGARAIEPGGSGVVRPGGSGVVRPGGSGVVRPGSSPAGEQLLAQAAALEGGREALLAGAGVEPESPRESPGSRLASGLTGAEFVETLNGARQGTGEHALGQGWNGHGNPGQEAALAAERTPARPGAGPRGQAPGALSGGRPKLRTEDVVLPSGVGGGEAYRPLATAVPPAIVTGHVVKGSMAKDRLSHEALNGVSSGVKGLYLQGGGEMVVRLKPDNLGELHVRVVTNGRDVGLKIRASDSQAKKVLEDSMGYLRDSLAQQQLQLSRVDVSVAAQPERAAASAFGGGLAGDAGSGGNPQPGNSGGSGADLSAAWSQAGWSGASAGGSHGRSDWGSSGSDDPGVRSVSGMRTRAGSVPQAAGSAGTVSRARVANGRIDVMA